MNRKYLLGFLVIFAVPALVLFEDRPKPWSYQLRYKGKVVDGPYNPAKTEVIKFWMKTGEARWYFETTDGGAVWAPAGDGYALEKVEK